MAISDITHDGVLKSIEEYDRLGAEAFLRKYGFATAKNYFLLHDGREYDSKAILGVAHAYSRRGEGPLKASDFSGGDATVKRSLERLGFTVKVRPTADSYRQYPKGSSPAGRTFGELPGVAVGTVFPDRRALAAAGVHRPLQAGIAGTGELGAESIVASGGYEDDRDDGDEIIYTGQGGNDPNTGRQIADQELRLGNLALARSAATGEPVRVVRGRWPDSAYAPPAGYRYDGLYVVDDYWTDKGKSGFRVYRYRLRRSDAAAPAWAPAAPPPPEGEHGQARRTIGTISRIIRNTAVTRWVKELYEYRCQVCRVSLDTPAGPYAEGAHIRPLGSPHNGPDTSANVLCLCPNHHVMFDLGAFLIADDFSLIGIDGRVHVHPNHSVAPEHLAYHRAHWST